MAEPIKPKAYKTSVKPIWCPGCGHYAVLSAVTKALAWLKLPKEKVGLISGIGCSSRIPAYVDTYGFHGIHGRALPLASGLKAARPDLTVLVAGGDGDGYSIGGNHFLHACRRNIDMTYIVMDNRVYGMTKGQPSPTSRPDWPSKLAPHGTGIRPFRPLAIALASGAGFIARSFSGDPNNLTRVLVEAIEYPGFAFIEVLSPCRTYCPEQVEWKHMVHDWGVEPSDDPVKAAQHIHADDGMGIGLVYRRQLPVLQPRQVVDMSVEALQQEFEI
ncbi:MAG: 2-oxoacid:ferredoxin oxidoreductase subunit beta [Gammaproteobacteria bacterium]|nr:MAG: 2-oxoacid:ferredoxin oxidoreductase subunit beta [Gammaproteobacteria bacterium]